MEREVNTNETCAFENSIYKKGKTWIQKSKILKWLKGKNACKRRGAPQTEPGSPDAATRVISKLKGKIVSPTNREETKIVLQTTWSFVLVLLFLFGALET